MLISKCAATPETLVLRRVSGSFLMTCGYSQSGHTILAGIQKAVEKKEKSTELLLT